MIVLSATSVLNSHTTFIHPNPNLCRKRPVGRPPKVNADGTIAPKKTFNKWVPGGKGRPPKHVKIEQLAAAAEDEAEDSSTSSSSSSSDESDDENEEDGQTDVEMPHAPPPAPPSTQVLDKADDEAKIAADKEKEAAKAALAAQAAQAAQIAALMEEVKKLREEKEKSKATATAAFLKTTEDLDMGGGVDPLLALLAAEEAPQAPPTRPRSNSVMSFEN
jgi:hypothetical protein